MARDNILPGSSWLKRIDPVRRTPTNCIVFVWLISCLVILGLKRLEIITSISAVATYVGYAGIILAAMRGLASRQPGTGFSLGSWRPFVVRIALAWVVCLIAALTVPVADPGVGRLPLKVMLGVVAFGIIVYTLTIRDRIKRGEAGPPPASLPEMRAELNR